MVGAQIQQNHPKVYDYFGLLKHGTHAIKTVQMSMNCLP